MKGVLDGLRAGLADRDRRCGSRRSPAWARWEQTLLPGCDRPGRGARPGQPGGAGRGAGTLGDPASLPVLAALLADAGRPETVRAAALGGLSRSRDPRSLRARPEFDLRPKTPALLVAAALPDLARSGFLPPNELSSFLEIPPRRSGPPRS